MRCQGYALNRAVYILSATTGSLIVFALYFASRIKPLGSGSFSGSTTQEEKYWSCQLITVCAGSRRTTASDNSSK